MEGLGTNNEKTGLMTVLPICCRHYTAKLAVATEVMVLSNIISWDFWRSDDILDLSFFEDLLNIAFNSIWDKSDQSNFAEINGYENFIGG